MVGAALLVAGPAVFVVLGLYPPMFRVWTVPRAEHLGLVLAHTRAWTLINAGFAIATIGTAAGLGALAATVGGEKGWGAVMVAAAIIYAIAGTLWCAVVSVRIRTTPALARMVAAGTPTEPAETLLNSAGGRAVRSLPPGDRRGAHRRRACAGAWRRGCRTGGLARDADCRTRGRGVLRLPRHAPVRPLHPDPAGRARAARGLVVSAGRGSRCDRAMTVAGAKPWRARRDPNTLCQPS